MADLQDKPPIWSPMEEVEEVGDSSGHARARGHRTGAASRPEWPDAVARVVLAAEKKATETNILAHINNISNPNRKV